MSNDNNILSTKWFSEKPAGSADVPSVHIKTAVSANIIDGNSRIELLDKETNLIDDKLLAYFNDINRTYDIMRDIEWETSHV